MTLSPQHSPEGRAFTDLILAIFRANGALISAGDSLVGDLGLSSARWQVLGMIVDQPLTVPAIARRVGLTRQGVQRTADRVVQDGLAHYLLNPDHTTSKLLGLTDLGLSTMAEVGRRQVEWANTTAQAMDAASMEAFTHLLQELGEQLQRDKERR
ncbi:MAG: transcriptional regulator, MarR family [Holophagaceae bacterium]|nr:transcriptional regulator, MarR family [Holophagaceae bacterium]